jgi:hypothetical protein
MRSVQASNQSAARSASALASGGSAAPSRRIRSIGAEAGCGSRRQVSTRSSSAKPANTSKHRSCCSIRCAHQAARRGRRAGEHGDAERPLLAGEFLALHEVEQGDEGARDRRIAGVVGRLEDDGEQAGDGAREARGAGLGADRAGRDPFAQPGQGVDRMQRHGDAAEQTRAVQCRQRAVARGGERIEALTHAPLERTHLLSLALALRGVTVAPRAEGDIGEPALLLQAVHQARRSG